MPSARSRHRRAAWRSGSALGSASWRIMHGRPASRAWTPFSMPSVAGAETGSERTTPIGPIVAGAVALVLVVLFFHGTARAMVHTWYESNTFNHDFLIIPICLYIGWRRRAELAAVEARPALGGFALVALASIGWLLGDATG